VGRAKKRNRGYPLNNTGRVKDAEPCQGGKKSGPGKREKMLPGVNKGAQKGGEGRRNITDT